MEDNDNQLVWGDAIGVSWLISNEQNVEFLFHIHLKPWCPMEKL